MAGATRGLRLTDAEDALVERELKASGAKSFNALARELIREALAGRGYDVESEIAEHEGAVMIARGIDLVDRRTVVERLSDLEARVTDLED